MSKMSGYQTFTVGKLDAGMAILIGERAHLIEFPSLLLPQGITSGSIVNISVHRNKPAEDASRRDFLTLQEEILKEFGTVQPKAPVLSLRAVTQTSVVLEWGKLELGRADIRSLDLYRNGVRLASIPNPGSNTSTKVSGLAVEGDYTFQLVLKTTSGTYPSNVIRLKTHHINDTTGISITLGPIPDPILRAKAIEALEEMGGRLSSPENKIGLETSHFVCSQPGDEPGGGPSVEYQKAMQMSLPIVEPQWVLACRDAKKMVPISQHLLGSNPPFIGSASSTAPAPFARSPSNSSVSKIIAPIPAKTESEIRRELEEEENRGRTEEEVPKRTGSGALNRGFKFPLTSPPPENATPTFVPIPENKVFDPTAAAEEDYEPTVMEAIVPPSTGVPDLKVDIPNSDTVAASVERPKSAPPPPTPLEIQLNDTPLEEDEIEKEAKGVNAGMSLEEARSLADAATGQTAPSSQDVEENSTLPQSSAGPSTPPIVISEPVPPEWKRTVSISSTPSVEIQLNDVPLGEEEIDEETTGDKGISMEEALVERERREAEEDERREAEEAAEAERAMGEVDLS